MSNSDIAVLKLLTDKVGRPFRYELEGERCTLLDLTSEDYIWHGLIRHHSSGEKQEILSLVCRLTGLKHLNLRRNWLGELPNDFENLRDLEFLDLGSNYLGTIPPQLSFLKRLKHLQVGNNDLTSLPGFISEFEHLESLKLHKNMRLRSVDNIAPLRRLKHLNLHYLNLHRFPPFIYEFRSLVTLTLWNVAEIGDEIEQLSELEYFSDCGAPGLKRLPDAFARLRKLRMARLFQNSLETLPENFGDLENLEQLSLYQNNLFRLPTSFAKLRKLKKLNLAWNHFKSIPVCLSHCRSLEWLAIFANALKHNESVLLPPGTEVLRIWPFTTLPKTQEL